MRLKATDIILASIAAILLTAFLTIEYDLNLQFELGVAVGFDVLILYVLQNQAKNYGKWSNHPPSSPTRREAESSASTCYAPGATS